VRNHLPKIYNGLIYFRKSKWAQKFFDTAKHITEHWTDVKKNILINCHDEYPSTDVVFALAYRIVDPRIRVWWIMNGSSSYIISLRSMDWIVSKTRTTTYFPIRIDMQYTWETNACLGYGITLTRI
jgi:hypothetical protein